MKKRLFIITLLLFFSNISYSQQVLNKLFEFKLGMTEDDMKIMVDTSYLKNNIETNLNEKTTNYSLLRYRLTPNYSLNNIVLSFFEGRLYRIQILEENPKTEVLLTQKYGEPKTLESTMDGVISKAWETNSKDIVCIMHKYFKDDDDTPSNYRLTLTDMSIRIRLRNQK